MPPREMCAVDDHEGSTTLRFLRRQAANPTKPDPTNKNMPGWGAAPYPSTLSRETQTITQAAHTPQPSPLNGDYFREGV